jgi:precorrin-8X/cobalt-precorrin-8 methylmutase
MTINAAGKAIETESFRIIREEMGPHSFTPEQEAIAVRVIHATADFDFAKTLHFSPGAVDSALAALRAGCDVVTDVRMVEVGISARLLNPLGGQVRCAIGDPAVREAAQAAGTTRSTAAMRLLAEHIEGGIVAVGNAPTALLEVIRQIGEEGLYPALVVGMPVGFVSAVESKDELATLDVPYITALGRKGGSTVAVATVNALLHLAAGQ